MVILPTVVGCLAIIAALFDVFQSLFHPAGRGALSDWIARGVWRTVREAAPRFITYAGPLALTATISTWAVLVVVGCALIFWPHMRTGFVTAPGLDPARYVHFFDALNLSLGSLVNFTNDSFAKEKWLRMVMGLEGIIGFGLLTASVSWLLSLYPVLEERRSLAQQATLLHHAEREQQLDLLSLAPSDVQSILAGLTAQMTLLRNQVAQFPITYYFHVGETETALPGILPYMADLALRASRPDRPPSVRLAGTTLGGAIDSYLVLIAEAFLRMPTGDKPAILRRYAEEQMRRSVIQSKTLRAA